MFVWSNEGLEDKSRVYVNEIFCRIRVLSRKRWKEELYNLYLKFFNKKVFKILLYIRYVIEN